MGEDVLVQRSYEFPGLECRFQRQRLLPMLYGFLRCLPVDDLAFALEVFIEVVGQQFDDDVSGTAKLGAVEHGEDFFFSHLGRESGRRKYQWYGKAWRQGEPTKPGLATRRELARAEPAGKAHAFPCCRQDFVPEAAGEKCHQSAAQRLNINVSRLL